MYRENLVCFYRQEPVKSARDVPLTVSTFAKPCLKPWQVVL